MGVGAGLYMCDVVKKVHVRYLISWWVLVDNAVERVDAAASCQRLRRRAICRRLSVYYTEVSRLNPHRLDDMHPLVFSSRWTQSTLSSPHLIITDYTDVGLSRKDICILYDKLEQLNNEHDTKLPVAPSWADSCHQFGGILPYGALSLRSALYRSMSADVWILTVIFDLTVVDSSTGLRASQLLRLWNAVCTYYCLNIQQQNLLNTCNSKKVRQFHCSAFTLTNRTVFTV